MPTLRQLTIRLAAARPDLQVQLLPLLPLVRTAGFSDKMLHRMVQTEAERLGFGGAGDAVATRSVSQKADAFVRTLSNALGAWAQARTLKGGVPAAMRGGISLLAYAAMGQSSNVRDWAKYTDEPAKLVKFLRGSLRKTHRELKDVVFQAALDTGS